jgi:glucose/arabinose dehydrogenase
VDHVRFLRQRRRPLRSLLALALTAPALLVFACDDPGGSAPPPVENDLDDDTTSVQEPPATANFRVVTVVDGLEHPWGMAFLPDGGILVTERPGRLRLVRDGALVEEPVDGVPDVGAGGQGGLLDIALHPSFATDNWLYLSYAKQDSDGLTTAIARGRFEDDRLTELEEIYEAEAWNGEDVHFGSRLAFDAAGYLFITVGERGERDEAQNLENDQGTVLRLHDDGSIPTDNPFVDDPDHRPAVWALGIRNAQGLAFHPETGELWEAEHGPQGGDEINVIERGGNYGWPEITFGVDYDGSEISPDTAKEGMEQPLHYWEESPALSGLTIYTGEAFASWSGHLFAGGLSGRRLLRLEFVDHELVDSEALLTGLEHRIRDVRTGPDGFLYLLVDADDAPMLRLEPVTP